MKQFLITILVFILAQSCFSQTTVIDSLSDDGVLLDSNWKYHEGDEPAWAKPGFNDEQWLSIDPTKDIHDLPALWNNNIVWLRLHFSLNGLINNQPLGFLIEQTGASEIYLNGNLIKKFGKINDGKNVIAATPSNYTFIDLKNYTSGKYIIAVRFAIQKNLPYIIFAARPNPTFKISIVTMKDITSLTHDDHYLEYIRVGLYLILAVLHLALFWFYPSQKANLFFFLFAFLFACLSFLNPIVYKYVEFANTKVYSIIIVFITFLISMFFFLTAVYKIFNKRRGFSYWVLACFLIFSVILIFINYSNGFIAGLSIFPTLIFLESARVAFIAIKSHKRGAGIIISGAISFIIFFTIQWLIVFNVLPGGPNWIFGDLAFFLSFLSLPVSVSILLALESTFAARSLVEKLKEVQILSDKTFAQEQEKQQILAAQNETLEKQVTQRTAQLNQSLENLKATQSQLIQTEKMASLGELTAGIAHEIQNPLNFVNNFSEVNKELIDEMNDEMDKGNIKEAKTIASDLQQNLEKINHHGRRADAIVKGMLQHSQQSKGLKEPTNINALADEYLRLSYHGIRAKDKDFNATIKTEFDKDLSSVEGKINIIPQDIGRVLLNLYNNAFYAVNEKTKQQPNSYDPMISVTTKKINNKIEIKISDNGSGIPKNIVDKIFQPFFTTKPTGQGTGLGLSLSYDIIKAHGGEIKVESNESEGTTLSIQLPNM